MFPFMMVLFLGCVEVTQLVRASMGLGVATDAMADLLSHADPDTAAQVTDACNGAKLAMAPFSGGTFAAAVANVKNTNGTLSVSWSNTTCGGASAITNATTLGSALVPNNGDEVTLVQTSYTYTAVSHFVLSPSYTFTSVAMSRPRPVSP